MANYVLIHGAWHTGELVEETIENMETVLNNEFPKLMASKVKQKDIVNVIQMFPTTQIEHMVRYLTTNKPKTHWDLFNAATWTATHAMKRNNEATHKIEAQIFPLIKKMVKSIISMMELAANYRH